MIIALSGYAGSGKNLVGSLLVNNFNFYEVAFADKLRSCIESLNPIISFDEINKSYIRYNDALLMYGYDEAKKIYPEFRSVLQKFATDAVRQNISDSIWVDIIIDKIKNDNNNWVITDCRFPNEADAIKSIGGQVWRIKRKSVKSISDHISEHALDNYNFDLIINNDSTIEDLKDIIGSHIIYE